jgi:hypothetical protein
MEYFGYTLVFGCTLDLYGPEQGPEARESEAAYRPEYY